MDLAELIAAFEQSETALIRVDRGDDTAWAAVLEAVNTPVDIVGSGHPEDFVIPNYTVVDHDTYDGASVDELIAALAAANHQGGYALLADSMTMTEAAASREVTLAYVDLWSADTEDDEDTGRAFRCAIAEVAAIEANCPSQTWTSPTSPITRTSTAGCSADSTRATDCGLGVVGELAVDASDRRRLRHRRASIGVFPTASLRR